MQQIILFASGQGTNASAIIDFFRADQNIQVALIVCNNPHAGVIEVAANNQIPVLMVNKQTVQENAFVEQLKAYQPTLVVLAGFLWKIPEPVLQAFPHKIINIHPALLPKYGGKGMYGMRVHEAVHAAGEKESGISIHWVNEQYDEGAIILQAYCPVSNTDTPGRIAQNIHRLEHYYLPRVIEFLLG
jgi:phosphoribosylglycinamide formyltransferase-1